jgi:hypothetical protein
MRKRERHDRTAACGRDESFAGVADEVAPCDVAVTTSASALQEGDAHVGQLSVNATIKLPLPSHAMP